MKKAAEYRRHAAECFKLAQQARNEVEKQQILKVAKTWEDLAAQREASDRETK